MKIKFQETPEQLQLIAAMGSKKPLEAQIARETFADLIAPRIGEVFNQADTTNLLYRDLPFREDDTPTFPLEIFTDVPAGYFTVWSQNLPGGLPTNTVYQPIEDITFTTYKLDSAISYLAKYARQTRLPVVAKALERLVQEILYKTQSNAWSVILAALAQATHNGVGHVFSSATPGQFTLDDFNKLLTFFRRLNRSWVGGTPIGGAARPTDIVVSPEIMESFRSMAYNAVNTKVPVNITPTQYSDSVPLPEDQRREIFRTGGVPEFFGINVIELLELGINQPYEVLFEEFMGSTTIPFLDPTVTPTENFDPAADDLILVVDASRDFAYRAIQTDSETGSVFRLENDDQFVKRSEKIGQYGSIREGRLVLDTKGLIAMVV